MTTPSLLPTREPRIILLDYQCTLVANADGRKAFLTQSGPRRPYTDWIAQEVYRDWLLPLMAGKTVILITARRDTYREATMERIMAELDWLPDEWYFNRHNEAPAACKRRVMETEIMPHYGTPEQAAYLALESNATTRAMYARLGVQAVRVPETGSWTELPNLEA